MSRNENIDSKQPLLSSAQKVSCGEFEKTNLSADRFVFTPEFAKSVYDAIYHNSFGRTSTTAATQVGEHLAFFPDLCVFLHSQMEKLRFAANGELIVAFLTTLRRMNCSIQDQNKKCIELGDNLMQKFAKKFQEQVDRIFSYISVLYLTLGQSIQRINESQVTAFSQQEIGALLPSLDAQQREHTEYCKSGLQKPEKLFVPAIAVDVYGQLIDFSCAKNLTYLFVESDGLAIRDLIENASGLDDYVLLIAKLTEFQHKSSDSEYRQLLKA